ncbi:MAG: c-type cytochrome, partial [Verrucomicrobiales bacterium]|nr:c-type cytochrome [Verrucomicrobiales bacterium]
MHRFLARAIVDRRIDRARPGMAETGDLPSLPWLRRSLRAAGAGLLLGCVLLAGEPLVAADVAGTGDDARMETLARLVRDESPRVRVEALRALAKVPTARAAELALSVLSLPMDGTLDYALWLTINDLAEPWIEAVRTGAWKAEGRERELVFALEALKPEQAGRVLGAVLGDRSLPKDGAGPWIEILGKAGSPAHLRRMLDQAVAGGFDAPATARVLKALGEAARLRKAKPEGSPEVVAGFFANPDPAVRTEAMRLAGLWKDVGGAVGALMDRIGSLGDGALAERATGIEALRQIGGDAVVARLREWSASGRDAGLRRTAATALAALDASRGFPAAVEAAGTVSTEAAALEYWRGLLAIKGSGQPLREALQGRTLPEVVARAGMRVSREGGRDDVELVAAFSTAGGLGGETGKLTEALVKEIAERAQSKGDPHRGERVYRRSDLACTTCHAVGGAGGRVGPDMTSIGASAPVDYLVESLVLPNAKIKEGYHAVIVETRDGDEYTGTVARETQQEIVLRNASGQEVSVAKASIARRENGKLSLMPSGLLEPLTEQDRLDLVAFLSRLGKPGAFDASQGGVARVWYLGNVVHT